jgi:hypothetical protein
LDVIETKSQEFSSLLITFTSTNGSYYLSPKLSKSGLKLVCNVTLDMETSSLRTPKIMPRNLNEIVLSLIQLQYIIEENFCK